MISSECKIHVKNFFQLLSLLFAGAAGLTGLYRFTTEIQRVNAIFYDLTRKDGSYTPWWIFAAGARQRDHRNSGKLLHTDHPQRNE